MDLYTMILFIFICLIQFSNEGTIEINDHCLSIPIAMVSILLLKALRLCIPSLLCENAAGAKFQAHYRIPIAQSSLMWILAITHFNRILPHVRRGVSGWGAGFHGWPSGSAFHQLQIKPCIDISMVIITGSTNLLCSDKGGWRHQGLPSVSICLLIPHRLSLIRSNLHIQREKKTSVPPTAHANTDCMRACI